MMHFLAEFDAMIRAVKADALREMADALDEVPGYAVSHYDRGRVDQRHQDALILLARADQIEKEGDK